MTYAFDEWMKREHPKNPFSRYADDAVAHCQSEAEAKRLLAAIDKRLKECLLEMHPEKSGIVYCKDSNRRKKYQKTGFTLLGYEFRPRIAKGRDGRIWTSFLPAISASAKKRIRQAIREWDLPRQTFVSLNKLARQYNPHIRGLDELLQPLLQVSLAPTLRSYRSEIGALGSVQVPQVRGKAGTSPRMVKESGQSATPDCSFTAAPWESRGTDNGSRVTCECPARFCEGLWVKLPRSTLYTRG
jgi:hypothetical protein